MDMFLMFKEGLLANDGYTDVFTRANIQSKINLLSSYVLVIVFYIKSVSNVILSNRNLNNI